MIVDASVVEFITPDADSAAATSRLFDRWRQTGSSCATRDTITIGAGELALGYDNHLIDDMLYVALAQGFGELLVTLNAKLRRRLANLNLLLGP
ncbi:MAG: hypothetical protein ACRDTC_19600 [Pseudonocardiaceae bacterium]